MAIHSYIYWLLGIFLVETISKRKFIASLYNENKSSKHYVLSVTFLMLLSLVAGVVYSTIFHYSIIIAVPVIISGFVCWFGAKNILKENKELIENEFNK